MSWIGGVADPPACSTLDRNRAKNPCLLCSAAAYCCGAVGPRPIAALLGRFLPRLGPLVHSSGPFFLGEFIAARETHGTATFNACRGSPSIEGRRTRCQSQRIVQARLERHPHSAQGTQPSHDYLVKLSGPHLAQAFSTGFERNHSRAKPIPNRIQSRQQPGSFPLPSSSVPYKWSHERIVVVDSGS
jgi:hypothetical protein